MSARICSETGVQSVPGIGLFAVVFDCLKVDCERELHQAK